MGQGPSPFSVPDTYQTPIMPPSDLNDLGTLDYQNSALTTLGKANNNFSDLAMIAQLGSTAGGAGPEQFQPNATYEAVKAPGYEMIQYYKQSNDPVMQYVATRFEEGATAGLIENELRTLWTNGDQNVKPYFQADFRNPSQPDLGTVPGKIAELEKNIINDPTFNAFDPATGKPANAQYDETEIAKYYREQGIPNPYEQYSPDLLAGRSQLQREGYNANKATETTSAAKDAQDAYARMLAKNDPRNNDKPYGMTLDGANQGGQGPTPTTPQQMYEAGVLPSSAMSVADMSWEAPTPNSAYDTITEQRRAAADRVKQSTMTGIQGNPQLGSSRQTPIMDAALRQSALRAQQQAYADLVLANKAKGKSRKQTEDDKYAQLERQRMIDILAKRGYTPANDVIRARQAAVYGA